MKKFFEGIKLERKRLVKSLLIVGGVATLGFVAKALIAKDDQDEDDFEEIEGTEFEDISSEE